jgi:seryl-tRNA synthetase
MLDIKLLKKDPKGTLEKLRSKDPSIETKELLSLYEKICEGKTQVEAKKASLNQVSKENWGKKKSKS